VHQGEAGDREIAGPAEKENSVFGHALAAPACRHASPLLRSSRDASQMDTRAVLIFLQVAFGRA